MLPVPAVNWGTLHYLEEENVIFRSLSSTSEKGYIYH